MANMTLAIPDEIQAEMKKFSEIRWSEVARLAFVKKMENLETLEKMDRILSKSKLTQKDVDEFDKKIKTAASKRFRELAKKQGYL